MRRRQLALTLGLVTAVTASACSRGSQPDAAAKESPAEAASSASLNTEPSSPQVDDTPMPKLRTGELPPEDGRALVGSLTAEHRERGVHYAEIKLELTPAEGGIEWDRLHIEADGLVAGQVPVVSQSGGGVTLLVRSAAGKALPAEVSGAVYGSRWEKGRQVWTRFPFKATTDAGTLAKGGAAAGQLPRRWVSSVREALTDRRWLAGRQRPTHPWEHFAAARLETLLGGSGVSSHETAERQPRTDLVRLMDTTSGILSIQEALQHDRGLRLRNQDVERTIPLGDLSGPPLAEHPFAAMQAELPDPEAGAPEPLAAAAPADFWYARFDSLPLFLRLLGEADRWITPLVQLFQQNPEDRRLAQRYETELGVVRGELAKILGPVAVGQVAVVGSDPYIREGTDLTLIFQVREATLFNAEIDRYRLQHVGRIEALGGTVETETRDYQGVAITSTRDDGGRLRQERAMVGELGILSNSPRAIERVLDTLGGRHPRLSEAAEFRYMRARDPGAHQFTAFLSDSFIAAVVGPEQKIQASRRERALAELLTPGYSALLYGWLYGETPKTLKELHASGLLLPGELRHSTGEPIRYEPPELGESSIPPDQTTRSAWGTPAALVPLLDGPPVEKVTAAEDAAYRNFARGYQNYWKQMIDPVQVSLDIVPVSDEERGGETVDIDVRVLPLIDATDYRDLERIVGTSRVDVRPTGSGLQAVWAVGADSSVRNDLDGLMRAASGKPELGIGWVGDWVMLGVEDRVAIADLFTYLDDRVQLPDPERKELDPFSDDELWIRLGKAPVYAAAEVKNTAALVATLSGIRALVNEVAPGTVDWGEHSTYRDLPIVRVGVKPNAPMIRRPKIAEAFALYYIQTGEAFVIAVDPEVLHAVADRLLAGETPKPGEEDGAQLIVEARSEPGKAMWTVGSWLFQGEAVAARGVAERAAEILYMGSPGSDGPALLIELGHAYLGGTPLSARGSASFLLGPTGAGDPAFGTPISPVFPELPLAASPVQGLMARLLGFRVEVSFDKEPAAAGPDARSLHSHLRIHLGPL